MNHKRTHSENTIYKRRAESVNYIAKMTTVLDATTISSVSGADANGQKLGVFDKTGDLVVADVAINTVEEITLQNDAKVTIPAFQGVKFRVCGGVGGRTYYLVVRCSTTENQTRELICRIRVES